MNFNPILVTSLYLIKTNTNPQTRHVNPREFHSLSYRLKGENVLHAKGVQISSGAGSLTFVPAGSRYTHRVKTDSEQIVAHFTTIENVGNEIVNFVLPQTCKAGEMFSDLYEKWELYPFVNNVASMAAFYKILASVQDYIGEVYEDKRRRLLKESVAYMNAHYRENDFKLANLYGISHISPAYYRRIFRQVYGCAPVEYMIKLRIEHAKRLLYTGHYTVSEVAELSGFSNQPHFSYEFKKRTGSSPSQYAAGN